MGVDAAGNQPAADTTTSSSSSAPSTSGLLDDRRRLLEHALQAYTQRHGGRLRLPATGRLDSRLLDALDVGALLPALSRAPGAAANGSSSSSIEPLDLSAFCSSTRLQVAAAAPRSRRHTDDADAPALPVLQLPALSTDLGEAEVQDLAFLVLAATCPGEGELLSVLSGQLGIEEARAQEAQRLLAAVSSSSSSSTHASKGQAWSASLELPLCMLGALQPRDFSRFRSFVLWRDTLSHVLLTSLSQNVRDGWQPPQPPPALAAAGAAAGPATPQQLTARLKAALRRLDVRAPEDYEDAEYGDAAAAVRLQACALAQCTAARWALPWGLRMQLYQALLAAAFDSIDEAAAIEQAPRYLALLQARVGPLLGVCPAVHAALAAWAHFRQFARTQAASLLAETTRLLETLQQQQQPGSAVPQDDRLVRAVGHAITRWSSEHLSDYHSDARLAGGLRGPGCVSGLVQLLAVGARCSGAGSEQVGQLLVGAVAGSVAAELQRRLAAHADAGGGEAQRGSSDSDGAAADAGEPAGGVDALEAAQQCRAACRVAAQLMRDECDWTRAFGAQLPEAHGVAAAVVHAAVGRRLLPWLASSPPLDEATCEALRAALSLEPLLMQPIQGCLISSPDTAAAAAAGAGASSACRYACSARLLGRVEAWDMPAQLTPLLGGWLSTQMAGFGTWVDRQLQSEDWRPLGAEQPHCSSARELRRIALESLEALFGLGLPLPPAVVRQHMDGIAGMMTRYLEAVLALLGSPAVMVPPSPHLTRYKREVAVKQEEAEAGMPGLPLALPPPGCTSRRGVAFEESVPRTEQEPCAGRVAGLSCSVLVVMMASLAYLAETLQLLASTVKQLRQEQQQQDEEQERAAGMGSAASSGQRGCGSRNPFEDSSSSSGGGDGGDGAANPFLDADLTNGSRKGQFASSRDWQANGAAASAPAGSSSRQLSATRMQWSGKSAAAAGVWGGSSGGGSFTAGSAWGSSGGGSSRDEQLGSSLRDTTHKLRGGVAAVTRWLAVRVVWWEQRAGWCELLYRHRVGACRIEWLLEALASTLQDVAGLLPQEARGSVALALLREAARALERALLDGGPCRWFIPADAVQLQEDVEALKGLFFQAGVQMQDIRAMLAGLQGVLALVALQTGPLIDAHRVAQHDQLLQSGPGTPPGSGGGAPQPQQPQQRPGGPDSGRSGGGSPVLGPLAAAKLAAAAGSGGGSGGGGRSTAPGSPLSAGLAASSAAAAAGGSRGAPSGLTHHSSSSRQPTTAAGNGAGSFSAQQLQYGSSGGGGGSGRAEGAAAAAAAPGAAAGGRRMAMDVAAAGGAVERHEPTLLRVLCHRADHAASKYLKEAARVPKAREETLGEALGRLARLNRVL